MLIDATYAGLIGGAADMPLVIPALNRDGDCLSDLVMPMFGSIAGAESVLLAFDDDFETQVAMAEAPHGTAPALQGKDLANPMAMLLACAAVLHYASLRGRPEAERASRAIYESVLEASAAGDPHAGPRRARDDQRVHDGGREPRPDEDRRLVVAGLDGLARPPAPPGRAAPSAASPTAASALTTGSSRRWCSLLRRA